MKQILRQTLTIAGTLCLTIGGIAAQPHSFASQEPFKTQFILGVNFMPEWQIQTEKRIRYGGLKQPYGFSPNVGLSFEARITRHSGIETGFYYRTIDSDAGITTDGLATHYPAGYRRYFSIPLLYRYYSRFVNVGVGITYDILFKESEIAKEWDGKNRVGIMLKVSKDITLYKGLFVEPEFHFNPFWEGGDCKNAWIGFQVGVKYRF